MIKLHRMQSTIAPETVSHGVKTPTPISTPKEEKDRVDLYYYIRPIACVGAVFGLFPLLRFYKKDGPGKFKYFSVLFLYGLILVLLFIISFALTLFYVIIPSFTNLLEFNYMLRFLFTVLSTITSCVCAIIHMTKHSKLGKLYEKFEELDRILPSNKQNVAKVLKYGGGGFTIYFLLTEVLYIIYEFNKYDKKLTSGWSILILYNIILTSAIPTFILLHGAGLSLCTAMFYSNLNRRIENLLDLSSLYNAEQKDHGNQIEEKVNLILKEVEEHRHLHLKIWSFTRTTSDYLSTVLFVVLTSEFVVICYNIYEGMVSLYTIEGREYVMMNFMTALTLLLGVGILSWTVDVQMQEHDKTAEIINWCNFPSSKTNEVPLYLLRFSLQILQSKPLLNVNGFFSVDRCFFLSMFGTLCTYVVILLQFKGSEDNSSCCEFFKNVTNITDYTIGGFFDKVAKGEEQLGDN